MPHPRLAADVGENDLSALAADVLLHQLDLRAWHIDLRAAAVFKLQMLLGPPILLQQSQPAISPNPVRDVHDQVALAQLQEAIDRPLAAAASSARDPADETTPPRSPAPRAAAQSETQLPNAQPQTAAVEVRRASLPSSGATAGLSSSVVASPNSPFSGATGSASALSPCSPLPAPCLNNSPSRSTSASVSQTMNTSFPAPTFSNSSRTFAISPLNRSTDSNSKWAVVSIDPDGTPAAVTDGNL